MLPKPLHTHGMPTARAATASLPRPGPNGAPARLLGPAVSAHPLTPRLAPHSELDERRFAWLAGQWQLISHQHLHYRFLPTWATALGGSLSWQPQKGIAVPEQRVLEELAATLPLGAHFHLQPRLRVEQRWRGQLAGLSKQIPGSSACATGSACNRTTK